MSALLAQLENDGILSMLDVELARGLAELAGEDDEAVLLAAALASQAVQEGHVCVDLAQRVHTPMTSDSGDPLTPWPELGAWLERIRASKLVAGTSREARPFVLDHQHKLYLARYHDHECSVAAHLRALATPLAAGVPDRLRGHPSQLSSPTLSAELIGRLFPNADGTRDLQREAALASRTRRLSIIVGGPGTGKTSTVVRLLALLVNDALESAQKAPKILLLAPTGKAAQRLSEATLRARDRLNVNPELRAAIPAEAVTIHRALGSIGSSGQSGRSELVERPRFRHDQEQPLDCDILLVDEASMIDLALLRRLLDAVPQHARVILLGDPDQLASVEAGGVLGDVCTAARSPSSPLFAHVSRLEQSYRYGAHSGIAQLAAAVHAGAADQVLEILRARHEDVSFHVAPPAMRLGRPLENELRTQYQRLSARELDDKLGALDDFRVLCAHRRGEASVESLNVQIARLLRGRRTSPHEHYAGRPILITQNDYAAALFNGDTGVLHSERRNAPLLACFRLGNGEVRRVSLGRLPEHESVYAMTVHKSQGSEFERVAVVLPDRPSPILTRELLYTAITRAKKGVSVYGSEASVRAAVTRRVERHSGLVERLQ